MALGGLIKNSIMKHLKGSFFWKPLIFFILKNQVNVIIKRRCIDHRLLGMQLFKLASKSEFHTLMLTLCLTKYY